MSSEEELRRPLSTSEAEPMRPRKRWTIYLLTLFACIGGSLFGYDTGVVSGAMVQIKSKEQGFGLSDGQQEVVVSITTAGAIVGAMFSGEANVRFGRRPVIILASVIFTIGALVMSIAQGYSTLVLGRIIVGLGVGIASHTVPMYIAEAAPADMRGFLVTLNNIFIVLGQVIASLVDCAFGVARVHEGWRYMLGLGAVPSITMFLGFCFLLPESPRWLAKNGKDEAAKKVLVWLRGDDRTLVQNELQQIAKAIDDEKQYTDTSLAAMFRDTGIRRALTLGCMLQLLQQLAGINTLMYYSATILAMAGIGKHNDDDAGGADDDPFNNEAVCLSAATAAAQMVGVFVGLRLIDRAGRRSLTLASLAGVVGALALLGFSFYGELTSTQKHLAIFSMVAYLLIFGIGMSPMPWAVNAEIYPLRCRASAISVSTSVNWISNYIVSATFLDVSKALSTADGSKEKAKHPDGAFWLYAAIAAAGWVWLYVNMPETKGKTLEEIEKLFKPDHDYHEVDGDDTATMSAPQHEGSV